MRLVDINHVAIRTLDLDKTNTFYTEVLGMGLAKRPPFEFPGSWLSIGQTMIHVLAGDAAYDTDGKFRPAGGCIDHISISAEGYDDFTKRFDTHKVAWREFAVPNADICQLFVRDPNGILIELNFTASREGRAGQKAGGEREYMPGKF
jgi:catechol 2,3-dioxygenase-like lactoylglutathione lyase family enzyme